MASKVNGLLDRIRSGERSSEAQEELYGMLSSLLLDRLRRKISPRLRARVEGEDVLHEAYLRALRAIEGFKPGPDDSFVAWVYRIAKNILVDLERRHSVAAVHFSRGEGEQGVRTSQLAQRRRRTPESQLERRDWIEAALRELPAREAEVIRLRSLEEKSFEEIADRWKKTPGAVQRFFSRAWNRLVKVAQRR